MVEAEEPPPFSERGRERSGGEFLQKVLPWVASSELLGDFFEGVALDDIARFVVVEIAELDPAFQPVADFFDFVLEAFEGGDAAVVDRLTATEDSGASRAGDATVDDDTAADASTREVEDLFDFGVSDRGFAEFRIEETDEGFFHLIDEFVDDAIEFDLDIFPFRGHGSVIFHFDTESDDDGIRGTG